MEQETHWEDRYVRFGFLTKRLLNNFYRTKPKPCVHIQHNITPAKVTESIVQAMATTLSKQKLSTITDACECLCSTCDKILVAKCIQSPSKAVQLNGNSFFQFKLHSNLCQYYWNYSDLWKRAVWRESHALYCCSLPVNAEVMLGFIALNINCMELNCMEPHHWKYLILRRGFLDYIIKVALYKIGNGEKDALTIIGAIDNAKLLIFVIEAKLSKKKSGKKYVKYCKKRTDKYYLECYGTKLKEWQWISIFWYCIRNKHFLSR